MLKRLSGTFSQSTDQLLLPPISPGGFLPSSGSAPSSPQAYLTRSTRGGTHSPSNSFSSPQAYPFPPTPSTSTSTSKPITLDRSTLHKSLQALSNLLVALDELRSASLIYSKAEKKVSKGLKELSTCWGDKVSKDMRDSTIADALLASAGMYDTLGEVDAKLAKVVQSDYEAVNELASKYFKKTAKEEKIFDDSLSTLDAKVSKATSSYNKYASKSSHNPHGTAQLDSLTASHSAYIQTLQSLQSQANLLQVSYGEQIALKRESVGREVARSVTGFAEKSWRNRVEGTRRGGECVGKVLAKGVWVSEGMENVGEYERQGLSLRGGRYEQETEEEETGPGERGTTPQPRSQSQNQVKEETLPRLESSKTLRGPRAPSTSTTDTRHTGTGLVNTSPSTSSHDLPPVPRPLSQPLRQPSPPLTRAASPQVSARDPSPQASRRPSVEEQATTNINEIGGGRTLPRGWYLDPSFANHLDENETELARTSMETQQHRQFESTQQGDFAQLAEQDSTPRPPPTERRQTYEALSNRREGETAILRKPTPRYGSAPASNEVPGAFPDQPDEFGRTSRGDEQREGEGRESFVRRMSQKYGAVAEPLRESRQSIPQSPPSHNRSNSRVSLLAKRYSSPPDASYPIASPALPNEPTSQPTSASSRRPLPPTHRSSTSLQFSLPSPRPSFTSLPSSSSSSHRSHDPSQSQTSFSTSSYSRSHQLPTAPTSVSSSSAEPHPTFCACQECTSLHYAQSGREQLTRDEEERLQRDLRVGNGKGTFKGLVGKGKEVFGRMG